LLLAFDFSQAAASQKDFHEPEQTGLPLHRIPVEPTGFVILAIGVVVSMLGAPYLIAHQQHGHPKRKDRHCQKILGLALAELFDRGVFGRAFNTAIPAAVIIRPVAVVFAILLIVLGVVGDQVVKREAVVTRHEIDTLFGLSLFVSINLGAADKPIGQPCDRT